jgi:hypothetical protein
MQPMVSRASFFFNVHWPSHEKLSFPGFQGLFFMYIDHPMISYLSVASRAPLMHEHEKTFYYHCGIQIIIIIDVQWISFLMLTDKWVLNIIRYRPGFQGASCS